MQGERLALASDDIEGWIWRFSSHPRVQLIDLDAAKGEGSNDRLIQRICAALPCRVGGGIRTIARAQQTLALGATHVIVGSSLFTANGVNVGFARELQTSIDSARIIAAIDSRGGHVVIHGWRTQLPITPVEAIHQLEPFVGGFLYTHVDREGLMQGTDMGAIRTVKNATALPLTAAGGITTREEIDYLDSIGVDAVVGMALYTGKLNA